MSRAEDIYAKVKAQNPLGTIMDRLPDLDMGPENIETTSNVSLRFTFIGTISQWTSFKQDVSQFYFSQKMRDAFDRTSEVPAGFGSDFAAQWGGIATEESVQVGAESTLSGRFDVHVIGRVRTVARIFHAPDFGTEEQIRSMPPFPKDVKFGCANIVPKEQQIHGHEPDVVVKIPGTGSHQKVRMVGEMKSCSTYKMEDNWADFSSMDSGSIRNLLGQIARDMRAYGVKYGYVSTYNETIFLCIREREANQEFALCCSEIIKHTNRVESENGKDHLHTISVRLALLYLLSRVSHEDSREWSINPDSIPISKWVAARPPTNTRGVAATEPGATSNSTLASSGMGRIAGENHLRRGSGDDK